MPQVQRPHQRSESLLASTKGLRTEAESKPIATTFGIEFEHIFAFHQAELERVLSGNGIKAEIIKDPRLIQHRRLLHRVHVSNRRDRWPEWVLKVPQTDRVFTEERDPFTAYSCGDGSAIRRYCLEPLFIARDALRAANASPVNLVGYTIDQWMDQVPDFVPFRPNGSEDVCVNRKKMDHSKWILMSDASLIGATKNELLAKITGLTAETVKDWDSHGIELASRIFQYSDLQGACREIHKNLCALKHESSTLASPTNQSATGPKGLYQAFDAVWAGSHVHIGFADPEEATLEYMQHFWFIIVTNEDLLTRLHPKRRSGRIPERTARANYDSDIPPESAEDETEEEEEARLQSEEEENVRLLSLRYSAVDNLHSNRQWFWRRKKPSHIPTLKRAAFRIFEPFEDRLSLKLLVQGADKDYIVSCKNLWDQWGTASDISPENKVTVEFRQHGCTLDATEVSHWVQLLFAILRMAQRMAEKEVDPRLVDEPDYVEQLSKYPVDVEKLCMCETIEEFCGQKFLQLPDEEIAYWTERYRFYSAEYPQSNYDPWNLVGRPGRVGPLTRRMARNIHEVREKARRSKKSSALQREAEASRRRQLREFLSQEDHGGRKRR